MVTFHTTLSDLLSLAILSAGLTFVLLLYLTPKVNRSANRFLALSLACCCINLLQVFYGDVLTDTSPVATPWLTLQFLFVYGPCLYLYVFSLTRPEFTFRRKDQLHFLPMLLQSGEFLFDINEDIWRWSLLLLAFVSNIIYLYLCLRLIKSYYENQKFKEGERYRYQLKWLEYPVISAGLIWLLWLAYEAIAVFSYGETLHAVNCFLLYCPLSLITIWMSAAAFTRPEIALHPYIPSFLRRSPPPKLKQQGLWLKQALKSEMYYLDAELSLNSLAEKLNLQPHELSRIVNLGLKKSFTDLINEYRVAEVTQKMKNPAYGHLTILGIAFEAGFSSKATFNRAFKQVLGKNPVDYKNDLVKRGFIS